jgi:hypothetical protein
MGTSMACAQCHTHKYDPLTNKEYFQFYALLNQTADADKKDEAPLLSYTSEEDRQRRDQLKQKLASIQSALAKPKPQQLTGIESWIKKMSIGWQQPKPNKVSATSGQKALLKEQRISFAKKSATDTHTIDLPLSGEHFTGLQIQTQPSAWKGNFVLSQVKAELLQPQGAPAPKARFVRIEVPGQKRMLQLAELQVFSGGKNIAQGKKATASSMYAKAAARLAVDGGTDGDYKNGSVAHTSEEDSPWLLVDLGAEFSIHSIKVWNRTDGNIGSRLAGYLLQATNEAKHLVWQTADQPAPERDATHQLSGPMVLSFARAIADYEQSGFPAAAVLDADPKTGWAVAGATDANHTLTLLTSAAQRIAPGSSLRLTLAQQSEFPEHTLGSYSIAVTGNAEAQQLATLPFAVSEALAVAKPTATQSAAIAAHYAMHLSPATAAQRGEMAQLTKQLAEVKATSVPIMKELGEKERRITRVQLRGNWQALDAEVQGATPAIFPAIKGKATRLSMAQWLVSKGNPLTARVTVNRIWEQIFGSGIVRTVEEFGSQGELPVNAELLDWLAAEFMDSGWDWKHMVQLMVSTAAYQQVSFASAELNEKDPDNRLMARGPRFRPTGEMLRDQALSAAGILSAKMYGPGVRPATPNMGLTTAFGRSNDWITSAGEDAHRRSVYTEVRRNSPYASFMTFDATNREICTLRRNRTNTPLQAFVTLNDPVFMEAAQALARRAMQKDPDQRLSWMLKHCLCREPSAEELKALNSLLTETIASLKAQPAEATKLATDPLGPLPAGMDPVEAAAWSTLANVVLNLDEFVMRP